MSKCDITDITLQSFDPIVDHDSKVLILGTMPGVESLRQQQYYAHPRNLFWTLIYEMFDESLEANYSDRIQFLNQKNIALWDVYKSCKREGSLDANINNEAPNEVAELINTHPKINYVFCNGAASEKQFITNVLPDIKRNIHYMRLPSTSPANASIPLQQKKDMWLNIRYALEGNLL